MTFAKPAITDVVARGLTSVAELHAALHLAMQLEFATIPPYLCAQWSIMADPDRVEAMLHTIVAQEMQHFALTGNILSALGACPSIANAGFLPPYPLTCLPGGIALSHPLSLSALTQAQLERFIEIERPSFTPVGFAPPGATIGAFYDTIIKAIETLDLRFDGAANQVEISLFPRIASAEDAIAVIDSIKQEGEGTSLSPEQPLSDRGGLAHYYLFKEILNGRRLIRLGDEWRFEGSTIRMPEVCELESAKVASPESVHFRQILSTLLTELEACWTEAAPFTVATMFQLGIVGRQMARRNILPEFVWLDE